MSNSLYSPSDHPTGDEKHAMWTEIEQSIPSKEPARILSFHWKSFWIGNAAAILIGFALVGVYSTSQSLLSNNNTPSSEEQVYETLTSATNQLRSLPPLLIDQASEARKSSLESTAMAIEEIDRLIEEIKEDILLNGQTPVKRDNLRRLYATKLEFYKELLLNEDFQS